MKLSSVFNLFPENLAYAHCDIPCGIYDPYQAQLAAHTVIRMTQMLGEVNPPSHKASEGQEDIKVMHDISRMTHVKEEHASLLESELMTLKNDYFSKAELKEKYPDFWEPFKKALESNTKARQVIDLKSAKETLESVMQIAEMFYDSKGLKSQRVKAPYPTGMDIVVQK